MVSAVRGCSAVIGALMVLLIVSYPVLSAAPTQAVAVEIRSDVDARTRVDGPAGGGGAVFGGADTEIKATTSPVVTTSVGGRLTAANDITIESLVMADTHATARAMSFAFGAAVGFVDVYATVDTNVDTYVGEGAEIWAGRDVKVASLSINDADALADANAIGAVAGNSLRADARITSSF